MNDQRSSCGELLQLFFRLGATSFGGPAVHIASMHSECVLKRKWVTSSEFLDLLAATNMIPGPNSTEMAIHLGYKRAGLPGLFVAGVSFIFPAAFFVTVLAYFYVAYGVLPAADRVLFAIKPVVIAIILGAVIDLARTAVKSTVLGLLGIAAIAASAFGVAELAVLFGAGGLSFLLRQPRPQAAIFLLPAAALATSPATAGLVNLFLAFLKIGSLVFGSGYVLTAFLQTEFVEVRGWLTGQQLLDAIAVSQLTPGPLFTAATFIGYILSGPWGALVATIGIFFPAFVFVGITQPFLSRLSRLEAARTILDGINVAAVALMFVVAWQLSRSAIVDATTACIAVASALLLARFRVNSALLISGAAILGVVGLVGPVFHAG